MMDRDRLRNIQDALVEGLVPGRDPVQVGPFLALFHPEDPLKWLNQCFALDEPSAADLEQLTELVRDRGRAPFFELLAGLWPGLPSLLLEAGFVCEAQQPLLSMEAGQTMTHHPGPGVVARRAKEADLPVWRGLANAAFGESDAWSPAAVSPADAAQVASGRWLAAIATWEGEPAGAGTAVGTKTIREIAGIGTLPCFRRRGVASAVTRLPVSDHFAAGGELAWLTAGDERSEAVYRALGFRPAGWQEAYALPAS